MVSPLVVGAEVGASVGAGSGVVGANVGAAVGTKVRMRALLAFPDTFKVVFAGVAPGSKTTDAVMLASETM